MTKNQRKQVALRNMRRPTLRGKGDYTETVKAISDPQKRLEAKIDHLERKLVGDGKLNVKNVASKIGRSLGNFAGMGDLGEMAGSTLAKYFGHGDYTVKSNSLMSSATTTGAKFSSSLRGTRIQEREFLGDVRSGSLFNGSSSFSLTNFNINPTDPKTFPWLSNLSYLYDQWEPHGIVFEFISTSSEFNGTSQALGAVIMATEYDPFDPPYTDKQSMENADYSCSTKPSNSLIHGLECDPRERPTAILYTSTTNGAPVTSTSLGKFGIATQGCSVANVTLGELWISYDLTFYKKQIDNSLPTTPYINAFGSTSPTFGYFAQPTLISFRDMTITQNVGVGSILNFNNTASLESYIVNYTLNVVGAGDPLLTSWTATNCTVTKVAQTVNGTVGVVVYSVSTTAASATLTTPLKTASAATWTLYATQVPTPSVPIIFGS